MSSDILIDRTGAVISICFNRPQKKNALTVAMYEQLIGAFNEAAEARDVRAILLKGAGDGFTSGNDILDFMTIEPSLDTPVMRFLRTISCFPKPIVAAVHGRAIGIGVTMLLHCDLVYATPLTAFQLPFVNLALCPEAASSWLLPRIVGYPKAAELLFLGERFSGDDALRVGLVNALFPEERLLSEVATRIDRLVKQPPGSLRATKWLLKRTMAEEMAEALQQEAVIFLERVKSPEAMEAFQAFMEKRAPDFSKFD